jgi:hypothetical protein
MKYYGLPSTPFTSYNYDDMLSPSRHSLHHFDDSSSVNGNDDYFVRFRDLENSGGRFGFNNSRFGGKDSFYIREKIYIYLEIVINFLCFFFRLYF